VREPAFETDRQCERYIASSANTAYFVEARAMMITLAAIGLLIVASAFFSASETALTAASPAVMHNLEQKGDRRARLVSTLRANKDRMIGAILLGNNLVNISASALATGLFIAWFGDAGVIYATGAMTLLVLIFGEVLPKTYAFSKANSAALWFAPLIHPLVVLLAPITHSIQVFIRLVLRPFGVNFEAGEQALGFSADELRGAIELHAGQEGSVSHERAMLRSVLELAEVQVGEIMIHRKNVTSVDADQAPEVIVQKVLESPYTRVPLWRDNPDNIVGVLHAKELLRALFKSAGKITDLDVAAIAAEPWFVPETTLLLDQLQAFRQGRSHFALVVDEYGSLLGIVTLEDILEEIVGDISDEHDIRVAGVRGLADGSYVIEGRVTIRDLNREFDWRLPDDSAATLAGLILHESRRIPEVGQNFLFHGFRFEILRRQRHQITSIRVTAPKTTSAQNVTEP
jgi:Mg2+/Co2+ transporter CorB